MQHFIIFKQHFQIEQYSMKKIIIHPLFVYSIICFLCCLTNEHKIVVYHSMPLKGDNFKTINNPTVYYFDGKGKYNYSSIECYESFDNPEFSTTYDFGGIKNVGNEIAAQIKNIAAAKAASDALKATVKTNQAASAADRTATKSIAANAASAIGGSPGARRRPAQGRHARRYRRVAQCRQIQFAECPGGS